MSINFSTSAQMFDAGYAVLVYDVSTDCYCWQYRDEIYRFSKKIPSYYNVDPEIRLAKIEDVRHEAGRSRSEVS